MTELRSHFPDLYAPLITASYIRPDGERATITLDAENAMALASELLQRLSQIPERP